MAGMLERGLSEEQKLMRSSCRAFVDDFVTPFIRKNWQREWLMDPDARLPAEILGQADRIGIRTLAVPEEYGGTELDAESEVRTFAIIAEEIARGDSGLADKLVQNWKVSVLLRKFAPRHLQDKWFPLLVEGAALGKAGIYFRPGEIIQAAKNLGVGMAAYERTADYVQHYVQGGRILIKHQAVALRLADMATRLSAVRALVREAASAVDESAPDADTLCNMAKVFASEEIMKVASHAMELHGGNGAMLDFGIEKLFRDASIFLHMDATADISRFKIVKSMFPQTAGAYAGPEA